MSVTRHIRHTHVDKRETSWCGVDLAMMEWAFVDIDHAVYVRMARGRLLVCPKCRDAVIHELKNKE